MTIAELLEQARFLSHEERKELAKQLIDMIDITPASKAKSGAEIVAYLENTNPVELVDNHIEDSVEWVKTQRRKRQDSLQTFWTDEQLMEAILDTTVIVHLLRRKREALDWLKTESIVGITTITWMEIMGGTSSKVNQAYSKELLEQFQLVYLTKTHQEWQWNNWKNSNLAIILV